ncbi:MAG: formyl-CoA transferase, partial [Alphaproteobacteria bacterium]|nr:formyl-CoA transferase [Alphaproteobacteria bacterium]
MAKRKQKKQAKAKPKAAKKPVPKSAKASKARAKSSTVGKAVRRGLMGAAAVATAGIAGAAAMATGALGRAGSNGNGPPKPSRKPYGQAGKALDGVRVLDFTHVQSGPTCTQLLGYMGADVIKIERPGVGDVTRGQLRDVKGADSLYFTMLNGNKRSITIDSKHPKGKEIIERLIKHCDVLVENFAPGALDRMGFTWEHIHKLNPRMAVAEAGGGGRAARALRDILVDLAILVRSGAKTLHRRDDHARIELVDVLPGKSHAVERAGREILHQYVTMLDQPLDDFLALRMFGIDGDRALVAVEHGEVEAV